MLFDELDSYKIPSELIINEIKWKIILRNIIKSRNTLLTGYSGSGKTLSALSAARCFNKRPLFIIPLGSSQDPRSTLIGNTHYLVERGTFFSRSVFVRAIQTENSIIILDELGRSDKEAINILISPLDYILRFLRVDEEIEAPEINVANGVSFIATTNIFGLQYTSSKEIDRALKDRFSIIEIDLLNENEEMQLLMRKFPTLNKKVISSIAKIAGEIRKEYFSEEPHITDIISTRATVQVCEYLLDGFDFKDIINTIIYPIFSDAGGVESERTFVKQIVQAHLENKNIRSISQLRKE